MISVGVQTPEDKALSAADFLKFPSGLLTGPPGLEGPDAASVPKNFTKFKDKAVAELFQLLDSERENAACSTEIHFADLGTGFKDYSWTHDDDFTDASRSLEGLNVNAVPFDIGALEGRVGLNVNAEPFGVINLDDKPAQSDTTSTGSSPWANDNWDSLQNSRSECRWHKSAEMVGEVSADGHIFTKNAGPKRSRVGDRGNMLELSSICMVFDEKLRCGGQHLYRYQILGGQLGAADGAGFVFDSKVRRNNIQRMRSVFLNQRGRICLRHNHQVTKLKAQLPPLYHGMWLMLHVDLEGLVARFRVGDPSGYVTGYADVSLDTLFQQGEGNRSPAGAVRSGFFCAVVTGNIAVALT